MVVASLILDGFLLLTSFPVHVQQTYALLTLSMTKMSQELFAYLLDVRVHITKESNFENVFLIMQVLHVYFGKDRK